VGSIQDGYSCHQGDLLLNYACHSLTYACHFALTLMPHFIRAASLAHYPELARRHGLDPTEMLRRVNIPLDAVHDPERLIPVELGYLLLEESARLSGVSSFGLEMSASNRLSTLGLIGLIAREEPSLRHALLSLIKYRKLHNEALLLRLEETGAHAMLSIEYPTVDPTLTGQAIEQGVAMMLRTLRVLCPPDWQPSRVCLAHAQKAPIAVYRKVLGVLPQFSAEFNGVALDAEDLDRPVQTADPALAHLARRQLDRLLEERGATSTEDRVRELAVVLLPMGRCTIEQVALHLGVHRRTLHRHLERQGLLFGDLVQQVRKDQARKLMRSPERPLTQVSELLGFSSPPAFSRWHRRQFGETAVAHQRRLQAEPPVKPTGQTRP